MENKLNVRKKEEIRTMAIAPTQMYVSTRLSLCVDDALVESEPEPDGGDVCIPIRIRLAPLYARRNARLRCPILSPNRTSYPASNLVYLDS